MKHQVIKANLMAWNHLHTTKRWEKVAIDVYGQTTTLSIYRSKGVTALHNCQYLIIDDNGRKKSLPRPGKPDHGYYVDAFIPIDHTQDKWRLSKVIQSFSSPKWISTPNFHMLGAQTE